MTFRILEANLAPLSCLYFSTVGFAPLTSRSVQPFRQLTVPEFITQGFDSKNMIYGMDSRNGRYFIRTVMFRGAPSTKDFSVKSLQWSNKEFTTFDRMGSN